MNVKNPNVVLGLAVVIAIVFVVGGILIASGDSEPERTSNLDPVTTTDTSIDFDSLYQTVVSQFDVDEENLQSFVFFGPDKVIYQDSEEISQVYDAGSGWTLGYRGTVAPSCDEVASIPDGYKISCDADPETGIVATEGDWTTADPNYFNYLAETSAENFDDQETFEDQDL